MKDIIDLLQKKRIKTVDALKHGNQQKLPYLQQIDKALGWLKLIEEKGRVEGPGRPILYGTTGYFLDYFGLKSLEELPDTQEMEISLEEDVSPDLFFDGMNKGE